MLTKAFSKLLPFTVV